MRREERQRCRRDALNAAGLTQARWTDGDELLLDLVGEARETGIVEVGGQHRRIVAAIAGDVLGLAVEINRVFRVSFKSGNNRSFSSSVFNAEKASIMRTTFLCGLIRPAYSRNGYVT